ncbi:hypothetical protein M422DRAFT_238822 [Sphaerobolus stellatus SS14]|nr:hypothetical protein M422DRAFT_238822 [Sphaerobolus stellatus SS14]
MSSLPLRSLSTELVNLILGECPQFALVNVCLANKRLCSVAQRLMFRKMDFRGTRNGVRICRTLLASSHLALHVRDLYIKLDPGQYKFWSFWTLLAEVLLKMQNIAALHFGPSSLSDVILSRCTFPRLKSFTSINCTSNELASFLERHPYLEQVYLGAEINCDEDEDDSFKLADSCLPVIRSFIGSRSMAAKIVPGRPISELTVVTLSTEDTAVVESLAKGSIPLQHFSCTSYYRDNRYSILESIANHLPQLETLRVNNNNIRAGPLDQPFLITLDMILPRFKQLRALHVPAIFNAIRAGQVYDLDSKQADATVVKEWHKLCPTLEFVTLPSCVEWTYSRGDKTWRGGNPVVPPFTTTIIRG